MKILREKAVKEITGLSRISRWRLSRRGDFPRKVQLSPRAIGWVEDEILEWLERRIEASRKPPA